jgi:hypothetical protein
MEEVGEEMELAWREDIGPTGRGEEPDSMEEKEQHTSRPPLEDLEKVKHISIPFFWERRLLVICTLNAL